MEDHALNATDIALLFADLQEGIVGVGVTTDPERLRTAVAGLADLAMLFELPVLISVVPTTSGAIAPLLSEIVERLPTAPALVRTTANPLLDEPLRAALEATQRRTLVIAGVATEVTVVLAAAQARRLGYRVIVAVDACSGLDARTEATTFTHLGGLGVGLSSVPAIAAELAGDFNLEPGRSAMRALQALVRPAPHAHADHGHDHDHDHGAAGTR